MHIQIVNFNLEGVTHEEYTQMCDNLAPAFNAIAGLVSKVWLSDPENNTYGGIYTWHDRQAMEAFTSSSIFNDVVSNPNLVNLTSKDFSVLEGPSGVTSGAA